MREQEVIQVLQGLQMAVAEIQRDVNAVLEDYKIRQAKAEVHIDMLRYMLTEIAKGTGYDTFEKFEALIKEAVAQVDHPAASMATERATPDRHGDH